MKYRNSQEELSKIYEKKSGYHNVKFGRYRRKKEKIKWKRIVIDKMIIYDI